MSAPAIASRRISCPDCGRPFAGQRGLAHHKCDGVPTEEPVVMPARYRDEEFLELERAIACGVDAPRKCWACDTVGRVQRIDQRRVICFQCGRRYEG